jgi:hypothetical protein
MAKDITRLKKKLSKWKTRYKAATAVSRSLKIAHRLKVIRSGFIVDVPSDLVVDEMHMDNAGKYAALIADHLRQNRMGDMGVFGVRGNEIFLNDQGMMMSMLVYLTDNDEMDLRREFNIV